MDRLPRPAPERSGDAGVEEAYVELEWLPFWQALDADARSEYLD
jgi:hypothetical protein